MENINLLLLLTILGSVIYLIVRTNSPRNGKSVFTQAVMCDSSALIDGRIVAVAKAGFLFGLVAVPSSVLREMQYLADNSDHDKRMRARHGLDVVHELQAMKGIEVQTLDDGKLSDGGVDERLIELSKAHNARLLTLDFNLNKVATAEGVTCLNINELAQSLRMSYLPGEKRFISLVQKGQDSSQAVGYLEDGTMVVVERAVKDIGSQIEIEFTRALQTQAGKMLFAKKVGHSIKPSNSPKPRSQPPTAVSKTSKHSRRRSPEDSLVELANK